MKENCGRRSQLTFVKKEQIVRFLKALKANFMGLPPIVWDGPSEQISPLVRRSVPRSLPLAGRKLRFGDVMNHGSFNKPEREGRRRWARKLGTRTNQFEIRLIVAKNSSNQRCHFCGNFAINYAATKCKLWES